MKRIARLAGLFSILLLFFAAALVMSQRMMHRQTERLRQEAIAQRQAQLQAAVTLAGLPPAPWPPEVLDPLGRTLDARIRPAPSSAAAPDRPTASWHFIHQPADAPAAAAILVEFDPPPAARLLGNYQRIAVVLLNLALGVIVVFSTYLLWSIRSREMGEEHHTSGSPSDGADLHSLKHLASVSARQGVELERERAERLRIEEDLHVKQLLLNRALEQKIRLGQDLHDGIIQSLYATGLTLESTRALVATEPAAAAERIGAATQALNTTIREVRAYINGLSPSALRQQTFPESINVLTRELGTDRGTTFAVALDPVLAERLPEDLATDLLQVVREAVSNSLRHGRAKNIAITLSSTDHGAALQVRDDGAGFTPATTPTSGHGLANISARIKRHQGTVTFECTRGGGAVITCRFPPPSPAIP